MHFRVALFFKCFESRSYFAQTVNTAMMMMYRIVSQSPENTKPKLSPRLISILFSFNIIQHINVTNMFY